MPCNILLLPILLKRNTFRSGRDLRDAVVRNHFGRLRPDELTSKALDRFEQEIRPDLADEWRRCMAEELLLMHIAGVALCRHACERFAAVSPFGNMVLLKDMLKTPCAMAVAPLHDTAGEIIGSCAHIWVCPALKGVASDNLDGVEIAGGAYSVFAVHAGNNRFIGRSWQLAFGLAVRALETKAPAEILASLASEWIVSGELKLRGALNSSLSTQNPPITKVTIGTKIAFDGKAGARYLFPSENDREIADARNYGGAAFTVYTAADLNNAWNLVAGRGTVHQGSEEPPSEPMELHSFVSAAWQPVVALALLFHPVEIVLWHTDNYEISADPARVIKEALAAIFRLLGRPQPTISLQEIDSRAPHRAEEQLRATLRKRMERSDGHRLFFNVTNGNRLQFFAAYGMAIAFGDKLTLIYRDIDATPFVFTTLRYIRNNPITRSMRMTPGNEPVNWGELFSAEQKKPKELTAGYILEKAVRTGLSPISL